MRSAKGGLMQQGSAADIWGCDLSLKNVYVGGKCQSSIHLKAKMQIFINAILCCDKMSSVISFTAGW